MPICPKCYSYYVRAPCPVCAEQEGKGGSVSTGTTLGTSSFPSQPREVNTQDVEDVLDSALSAQVEGFSESVRVGLPKVPREENARTKFETRSSAPMPKTSHSNVKDIKSEISSLKNTVEIALRKIKDLEEKIADLY